MSVAKDSTVGLRTHTQIYINKNTHTYIYIYSYAYVTIAYLSIFGSRIHVSIPFRIASSGGLEPRSKVCSAERLSQNIWKYVVHSSGSQKIAKFSSLSPCPRSVLGIEIL